MNKYFTKQGFTIIEVVLVLAIAGLIFLMVFVAFPALQRNQRESQRRQDFATLLAQLKNQKANGTDIFGVLSAANKASTCDKDNIKDIGSLNSYIQSSELEYKKISCKIIRNYTNNTTTDNSTSSTADNEFRDPNGSPYALYIAPKFNATNNWGRMTGAQGTYGNNYIIVIFGSKCNNAKEGGAEAVTSTPNVYTIRYRMEDGSIYCQDGEL